MSLTDVPQPNWTATQLRAIRVRELLSSVIGIAESNLQQVRNVVRGHYGAIAAELGPDAASMLVVFNKLKDAVEAGKNVTVEAIPNE